jgi:hypothetical protein
MRNCVRRIKEGLSGLFFLLTISMSVNAQDAESCTFVEKDGIVTVEMESADFPGTNWVKSTDLDGYTGQGYLEYTGTMVTGLPGKSMLNYKIRINEPGRYSFKARGYRNEFAANDVWVRFPQGGAVTALSGDTSGVIGDSWFKFLLGARDEWNYFMKTQMDGYSHTTFHDVYVDFPEAGEYTVEFCGRSTGFILDRFVLYKTSGFFGMNPENAESEKTDCEKIVLSRPYQAGPLNDVEFDAGIFISFGFSDTTFKHTENKNLDYVITLRANEPLPAWLSFDKETKTFSGVPTSADTGKYNILIKAQDRDGAYASGEMTLTIENPQIIIQAVRDERSESDADIYPNPSGSGVWLKGINGKAYKVDVFDLSGRRVAEASGIVTDAAVNEIGDLNSGVYIINISTQEGEFVRSLRFLKK